MQVTSARADGLLSCRSVRRIAHLAHHDALTDLPLVFSGSMSGDEKRSVAAWPKLPRSSSTLPQQRSFLLGFMTGIEGAADLVIA